MFVLLIVVSVGNGSIRANNFIQHLGCLNLEEEEKSMTLNMLGQLDSTTRANFFNDVTI